MMTYFEWLVETINRGHKFDNYTRLLRALYEINYVPRLDLDQNRYQDGIDLIHYYPFQAPSEEYRCSILAMMIALSIRIESEFMATEIEDRTDLWFASMLHSLGLLLFDDDHWNAGDVNYILNRFMVNGYKPNGEGGLFMVPNCQYDMRTLQIWDQMNQWILSNF